MTDIVRVKDKDGLVHFTARDSEFMRKNDVVEVDEHGKPMEVSDATEVDSPSEAGDAGTDDSGSGDGPGVVDSNRTARSSSKAQSGAGS